LLKVAVKGLVTRRLRAVLTALAIVLGVALVAGTYVLTDSLHADLGSVYQTIYKNTAASITGRNAIDTGANAANGGDVPTFPETLLARVNQLPGVAEASGGVSGTAQLVLHGKTVSFGSSPTLGSSVDPSAPQLSSLKLVSGHWPSATGLVVDTNTASKKHLKVGQEIGVQADGPELRLRISGIVKFGSASSLGGATLTGFTLPTAQRLFSKPGQLDAINVAAKSGTSPQQLVDQIEPILPRDAQVRTGAQQAQTDTNSLDSSLGFLNTLLLAFAGIALFVGAFVIANS
jgi:putative ABC transport system permease protein